MSCSCKKSGCTNNRCSCFKEGRACTGDCDCQECENKTVSDTEGEADLPEGEEDTDTMIGCLILLVLFLIVYWLW